MSRKLLFIGVIFLLLAASAATPISVRAEGDPPPISEPVKPPWITGKNPLVSISSTAEEDLTPSGIIDYWQGVEVPLLAAPPSYVDLEPQINLDSPPGVRYLSIPQRYQDPSDVTCGAAALGMALEFLSLNGEGQAPSQGTLISALENSGLLYETGTGVEELAFLARQNGYRGTTAFHDWTLEQLGGQLAAGRPVVVSLGANPSSTLRAGGENQPGHFVTLTGISEDGSWVSYNDPVSGKQTVSVANFMKSWNLQGNSGLVVRKEPLPAMYDPMLPWMGLFSALTMLAVMAKEYSLRKELNITLAGIQSILGNPQRKGLGGKLIPEGGSSSSPPYTSPPGYKWKKNLVTKYGWKNIEVFEEIEVPKLVKVRAIVKVNRWIEKIPVYKTVTVDRGYWAYRSVKKYRTERYRTSQRYKVKKSYWYRRRGRLYRGSYTIWRTRTVVKTRKVPYYDRERYWVPKIVTEQRFVRYREIEHRDPIYGWRMEKRGTRIIKKKKIVKAWKPVSTEYKWELEKLPKSPPTPMPYPSSTPTPTSLPHPSYTPTPTPNPSSTTTTTSTTTPSPSSTSYPSYTPIPTITPPPGLTSPGLDYEERLDRWEEIIDNSKTTKTYGIFGFKAAQKIIAGLQLNINQVDGTLRVFGPRAARSTLGLNPYTNWIKPANVSNILQSADEFKLSKLSNISTFLGLSLNIASNSVDLAQGDIDRFEYAAALTVDTGITAGSALLAGALSGAAIGFLVGGAAGAGVGAIPGAIAGGIVGAVVAIGGTSWLNSSGLRDSWVDSVADMYRKWVE